MKTRRFTLIFGLIVVILGILGFIRELNFVRGHTDINLDGSIVINSYTYLIDIFAVNDVRNTMHIAFGIWALIATSNFLDSRFFCKSCTVIFGLLTFLGAIPMFNTLFGLMPLFGNNIWMNFTFTTACAYFGWPDTKSEVKLKATEFPKAA